MDKYKQDIAYFISFCIEQYKNENNLTGVEAMRQLEQYHVLEYLSEHYEALHTQSRQWILEDIEEFIRVSKGGDKMSLDINQDNLYLLLPSKVAWLADMLTEDKDISIIEAVKEIYLSDTYRQLEEESTKKWYLGPVALYQGMTAAAQ